MARGSSKAEKSKQQVEIEGTDADLTVIEAPQEAGTATSEASPQANGKRPELTLEAKAKLAEIRSRIEISVGQVVLLMMQLPRYKHQTLADLNHLVLEPLLRDRIAIAFAERDSDQLATKSPPTGIAVWASVSEDVDKKIEEQVKSGSFPVRLNSNEWSSGETLWLLDVIAPTRNAATALMASFSKIAGDRSAKLHPIVAASVDRSLLERLQNAKASAENR